MPRHPLAPESPGAAIVSEEKELLERVACAVGHKLAGAADAHEAASDYDAELLSLRDQIAEAKPEDIAPLVEQMSRVAALAAGRRRDMNVPIDPASPYFAHLRLREPNLTSGSAPDARGRRVRDILIGRRGYIDRASGVQIVDWRDAPVSQIYYRYDEGDDYDEVVDARHLEGLVEARRSVSIHNGMLRRVGCPQGTFVASGEGRWFEAEGVAQPTLAGGQGKAARAPRPMGPQPSKGPATRDVHPRKRLGTDSGPVPRADKQLPEIAALIDAAQFDLITSPATGLVVMQGGAGSGKTTVALHRVAYLVFHDAQHFRPSRCLVVVPSQALERYVAGVLPALGVRGVPVVTFGGWARATRRKILPHLPDRYTEDTPPSVSRLKKHPAMLKLLAETVAERTHAAGAELASAVHGAELRAQISWQWEDVRSAPPIARVGAMARWATQVLQTVDAADRQRFELAITRVRRSLRDVRTLWAELLTDEGKLRAALPTDGPDAVRAEELRELVAWVGAQLEASMNDDELAGVDEEARTPVDGGEFDDSERGRASRRLDVEDDPLLLRIAQLLHGGLYREGDREPILYDHIAIDEAQDLSAIETKVLLDAAALHSAPTGGEGLRSITLAGDTAQRLVFDNGFRGWSELLHDIGYAGVAVRPLHLSYRSTEEVMRFARAVLGPILDGAEQTEIAARPGAPVEHHRFEAMGEAVAFVAESLRSLSGREPTASVALITRYAGQADAWYQALARTEIPSLRRVRRQDFPFVPGIDVTDVAQVKGLEFDYVVLLDTTNSNYPSTVEARHLMHIGATRAAHQLWCITIGTPSPLLPPELAAAE